jgi:hypothetical protein
LHKRLLSRRNRTTQQRLLSWWDRTTQQRLLSRRNRIPDYCGCGIVLNPRTQEPPIGRGSGLGLFQRSRRPTQSLIGPPTGHSIGLVLSLAPRRVTGRRLLVLGVTVQVFGHRLSP